MKRDIFASGKKLTFKNIRRAIITSFTLSFFFAIGLVLTINFFINKREKDIQAIISVSQQRVSSQIAIEKIYAATDKDSLTSELIEDSEVWANMYRAFQYGNPATAISVPLEPEMQDVLDDILHYQQQLFQLTIPQNFQGYSDKELNNIRELEIGIMYGLDDLSLELQKDLQKNLEQLKYIVSLSTLLFVLFIMGLYKFFVKHIINSVRLLSGEKEQQSQFITSILENTNDLIWAIDNTYRLVGHNSTFLERRKSQVGFAPKMGDSVLWEYYLFEKPSKVKEMYDRALAGDSYLTETEVYENGRSMFYEFSFNPTYDENKSVIGCSVYQRDVTQRIEASKELRQSESYLREAQEISKLGYWNWDILEDKISWSDQLYRIFGKDPNKFKANYENLMEMVHPEDRTTFDEEVRQCIAQNKPHDLAHRIVLDNGEIRYVHQRGRVHYDNNDIAIRMAGTTLDITSMEGAKQQISRQYKELQNFVYIISHNVRGPISTLQSLTHLYDLDKGESTPMIMANINKTVDTLDRTIIDLNNSLILKNVDESDFSEIDFAEILENIRVLLAFELEKCEAKIESDFTDAPKILGIKSYYNNIFYNLISNALKYRAVGRNPFIRLYSRTTSKEGIQIVVEDNGKGMQLNDDRRKRIFDMYGRLDSSVDGKGLGLYLVKTQIEAMNGSIEVHSELDKGSTFTITLFKDIHRNSME